MTLQSNGKEKTNMMKFGLLTSICEGMTFEEVVDFAAENQLECLEVACWPQGGAQRRYAGVSHIDVANLDEKKAAEIKQLCQEKGVEISSSHIIPTHWSRTRKKKQLYQPFIQTDGRICIARCQYDYNIYRT